MKALHGHTANLNTHSKIQFNFFNISLPFISTYFPFSNLVGCPGYCPAELPFDYVNKTNETQEREGQTIDASLGFSFQYLFI